MNPVFIGVPVILILAPIHVLSIIHLTISRHEQKSLFETIFTMGRMIKNGIGIIHKQAKYPKIKYNLDTINLMQYDIVVMC